MHQLQLIGIKTNLESFVTTTLMEHMLNRHQLHLFLWVSKQWGASGYAVTFPIAFNVVYNVLSIPQTTASTSNAYWGRFYITALTKNGFNVSDTGAGSNRWIAIGSAQPQWGMISNNKAVFPIAFTAFCSAATLCIRGSGTGTWYGDNANVTLTGLSCITPDYVLNGNFIVIGV